MFSSSVFSSSGVSAGSVTSSTVSGTVVSSAVVSAAVTGTVVSAATDSADQSGLLFDLRGDLLFGRRVHLFRLQQRADAAAEERIRTVFLSDEDEHG